MSLIKPKLLLFALVAFPGHCALGKGTADVTKDSRMP